MKKFLENLAAAAAMAQGGAHNEAKAILKELDKRELNNKSKFLFVVQNPSLPQGVGEYVAGLARRQGSHLLVIAKGKHGQADTVRHNLQKSLCNGVHKLEMSCFTTRGEGLELARNLCTSLKGVQFVLLHGGRELLPPAQPFTVPVYCID